MPSPLSGMDAMRRVEFTEALLHLQELMGARINVTINFYGRFFGCALAGELARVETLPPDDTAITVVLDDGQGFFLDPAETEALLGRRDEGEVLELVLACGATIAIENSSNP